MVTRHYCSSVFTDSTCDGLNVIFIGKMTVLYLCVSDGSGTVLIKYLFGNITGIYLCVYWR